MMVWQAVGEAIERAGRCALVTVVAARGSAPRDAGARLVVRPDGGFTGTIGGGALEWRAIAEAAADLAASAAAVSVRRRTLALGPELGQCCGGRVDLLVELFCAADAAEVAALAAREAAGAFETQGRIGAGAHVERVVTSGGDAALGDRFQGGPADAGDGAATASPLSSRPERREPRKAGIGGSASQHVAQPSPGSDPGSPLRFVRDDGGGVRDEGGSGRLGPAASAALLADGTLVERFGEDRRPLYLFGAGHVGRALVLALAPLPFAITWVDGRPGAFPSRAPGNVVPLAAAAPDAVLTAAPTGAFVLAMTHSHALDLAIVAAALAAGRFPYVGVIGSATKRARFERQLRDAGLAADRVAAMVCPIGAGPVRSKLPAAIAAMTAAELLARDEACAAAAGGEVGDGRRGVAG